MLSKSWLKSYFRRPEKILLQTDVKSQVVALRDLALLSCKTGKSLFFAGDWAIASIASHAAT